MVALEEVKSGDQQSHSSSRGHKYHYNIWCQLIKVDVETFHRISETSELLVALEEMSGDCECLY